MPHIMRKRRLWMMGIFFPVMFAIAFWLPAVRRSGSVSWSTTVEQWLVPFEYTFLFFNFLVWFLIEGRMLKKVIAAHGKLCEYCTYNLSGLPERSRCPECGKPYDLEETVAKWRQMTFFPTRRWTNPTPSSMDNAASSIDETKGQVDVTNDDPGAYLPEFVNKRRARTNVIGVLLIAGAGMLGIFMIFHSGQASVRRYQFRVESTANGNYPERGEREVAKRTHLKHPIGGTMDKESMAGDRPHATSQAEKPPTNWKLTPKYPSSNSHVLLWSFVPLVACGMGVILVWYRWENKLLRKVIEAEGRLCEFCAHDLPGLPERSRCPECGKPYDIARTIRKWQRVKFFPRRKWQPLEQPGSEPDRGMAD